MSTFNTFGSTSKKYGGGKNIWYEVKDKWPGGCIIKNLSSFKSGTVIPAGSMVAFDHAKHEGTIVKNAEVKTTSNASGTVEPSKINGLLENDIYVEEGTTVATGTVVYAGKIYADRLSEEIPNEVFSVLTEILPIREKQD